MPGIGLASNPLLPPEHGIDVLEGGFDAIRAHVDFTHIIVMMILIYKYFRLIIFPIEIVKYFG